MAIAINVAARTAAMEAMCGSMTTLTLYTGTRPASVDLAPTGTELVTFTMPAFVAVDGQVWLPAPVVGTPIDTGTATWGRWSNGAGAQNPMWIDGDVATSASDFNISDTSIVTATPVTLNSLRLTMPSE